MVINNHLTTSLSLSGGNDTMNIILLHLGSLKIFYWCVKLLKTMHNYA